MVLGRVQVPASVRKGEAFEVRVLVQHPMETGFRRDMNGRAIPLNVLDRVACRYGGREVFSAELGSGIAANPYLAFYVVAESSGSLQVDWSDDKGDKGSFTAVVSVG
jgi:thiosulfate oxidation carrier complex protein SoxZ